MSAGSLRSRTVSAARWAYLSSGITAVLQIGVTAALARLLAPQAFGLVALASLVLRFGQYFAQMGVGQAVVQRERLADEHVAAGFWSSLLIGALFSGATWALAPVIGTLFDAAELVAVVRVMGLSFFLTGTSTTAFGLLRRQMRFREIAIVEVVAYVLAYGGALALAVGGAGVWALVFAGLSQSAISSVAYNVLCRSVRRPVLRWRPYRELLGFGTTVSVVSFLDFLAANLDTMAVGRLAGPTQLGFYNRALSLTGLPMYYMSTSLSKVLLPALSRLQGDVLRAKRAYLSVITAFAGLGLPLALGVSGAAAEIVAVLLGDAWGPSVPVMRIVAIASVAAMLSHFGGVLLEATAHLRAKVVLRSAQLLVFGVLLLGLGRFGLSGYATAFALSELGHLLAQGVAIARIMEVRPGEYLAAYLPGLTGAAASGVLLFGESVLGAAAGLPQGVTLGLQLATGVLVVLGSALHVREGHLYRVLRETLGPPAGRRLGRLVASLDRIAGLEGAGDARSADGGLLVDGPEALR